MKHQLRDAQQRKVKKAVLENLNNGSVFWLRDFAQKILPCQFREGQKQYFGKKGISLHVDVMLLKEKMIVKKYVYYTVIYRCSQGMKDILNIDDIVLKKFKNYEPNITKCFVLLNLIMLSVIMVMLCQKLYLKFIKRMELTYCGMTSMNLAKARINVIENVQLQSHL